jgi:hypothetical protein
MSSFRKVVVWLVLPLATIFAGLASAQQVQLVNVIPALYSNETRNDSEPNVTVNPANTDQIVVSAFTPCPPTISNTYAPIYFSVNGGTAWQINCIVPGNNSTYGTGDITERFASSGVLYAGILRGDSYLVLNVLRSSDFTSATPMTILENRSSEDQPYTQAMAVGGDRVFIGNNQVGASKSTAMDFSQDAATAPPPAGFPTIPTTLENRTTCGQDMPPIRPAIHNNGIIYAAYYHGTAGCSFGSNTVDVVVARDDNWGAAGFKSLVDTDGFYGARVVQGVNVVFGASLGNERLVASQMSVAVDPSDSSHVYVAWAEGGGTNYTLHVRQSTTSGATWGPDIKSITLGDNPALAVNKLGTLGFLYQKYVNPGTCGGAGGGACWETHFETYDGTTWTDLPHPLANVPDNAGSFPLGDYEHVLAIGHDFYGVFAANNYPDTNNFYPGVQYQRYVDFSTHQLFADSMHTMTVTPSFDPFFFHVTNLPATSDFYVRDWTTSPSSHDNGEEPSNGPDWWTTSDVWNRLTNTNGGFNANDQPNQQNAQDATSGHNYAFVRVHRNAAPMTGPTVNVTARFVYADYGLGVAYQDVSASSTTTLTFSATDKMQTLADGAGVQWDLPATRSTHVCMAVEISAPGDPYIPELVGRAPGWPTTDWTIPADNNKAQINMDLPAMGAGAGTASFHAIAHNAAWFTRDMVIRYSVPPKILRMMEGAQIGIVGGKTQPLGESGTLILTNMQPAENRWIEVSYSAPNVKPGQSIPVALQEMNGDQAVNGFTIAGQPTSGEAIIRANLKLHRAAFTRLDAAFQVPQSAQEAKAAATLLSSNSITTANYLSFLNQHLAAIATIVNSLIQSQKSGDAFATAQAVKVLQGSVAAERLDLAANAHGSLLNKLDAFQTMLQKAEGDPADILQMVVWQRHLYSTAPRLTRLKAARHVVEESDEFIRAYGKAHAGGDSYAKMLRELRDSFHDTVEALECLDKELEKDAEEIQRHLDSPDKLEKAHRSYLLELQSLLG